MHTMKHIINVLQNLLLAGVLLGAGGCGDFDQINRNPNEVTKEELGRDFYDVGSSIKTLQSYVIPTEEHLYQFAELLCGGSYAGYAETTVTNFIDKFSVYNPSEDWNSAQFVTVLKNFYPDYRAIMRGQNPVAQALARICRVATMLRVTDTYGPIPFSGIVSEDNREESLEVAYDSQEEAYNAMFAELTRAEEQLGANLNMGTEVLKLFDGVYGGDLHKWMKFLNSLRLRMALRISLVNPALAQQIAEAAVAGGVIETNEEGAYLSVAQNRAAMIINSWGDHRVGADIVCYMNGYEDPRREKYFTTVTTGTGEEKKEVYAGMRIGIYTVDQTADEKLYSKQIIKDTDPFLWMNASEVTFLRAEGALNGWAMGGDAGDLYAKAIRLSFSERGVAGADEYIANNTLKPEDYKDPKGMNNFSARSTINIAWEEGAGDDVKERNLERIITQKWIAIYPMGTEAWAEFRRTGYPRLMPVPDGQNHSGGIVDSEIMIRRLAYPAEEKSQNNANLQDAIVKLGGPDNGATPLWWDVRHAK